MRQHVDHRHWYDRAKLSLKEIHNTQYVACMNPTAGSFTIDSRLQVRISSVGGGEVGVMWGWFGGVGWG